MIQGKYVMSPAGAILFPDTFNHSDFRFVNPVSAGRFSIITEGGCNISVNVFGESLTLELEPAEGDAEKIRQLFGINTGGRSDIRMLR